MIYDFILVVILGPNLDKNSVQPSGPVPFYENYMKLCFDKKHLKKCGLNRGCENCCTNIACCPNFLD